MGRGGLSVNGFILLTQILCLTKTVHLPLDFLQRVSVSEKEDLGMSSICRAKQLSLTLGLYWLTSGVFSSQTTHEGSHAGFILDLHIPLFLVQFWERFISLTFPFKRLQHTFMHETQSGLLGQLRSQLILRLCRSYIHSLTFLTSLTWLYYGCVLKKPLILQVQHWKVPKVPTSNSPKSSPIAFCPAVELWNLGILAFSNRCRFMERENVSC